MARTRGILIDNKAYNLVQDHETYNVTDVPAHPDADPRMERRVLYEDFRKGILQRKESRSDDNSIASLNVYNRVTKAGEGIWFSHGFDTRMSDRVYGQRAVLTSQPLLSEPIGASDYNGVAFIVCRKHVYTITGVSGGVQQIALSKDFTGIGLITDFAVFNKKVYVAVVTATSGLPDYTQPQKFWLWDLGSTWTQAPQPLPQPQWAAVNPTVTNGTPGTTTYSYYIVAVGAAGDSKASVVQTVTNGAASLSVTNSITLNWQAVTGATSYKVVRYATGSGGTATGVIAVSVAGLTFTDQGGDPVDLLYQQTPAYATTDIGNASAFVVVRNTLWRAAGAKMWVWDGVAATWSGENLIGDPGTPITALDVYNDGLVIFKNDGVYTMDRFGTVFSIFPSFRAQGFNPRPIGQWRGDYYIASDIGMVWQWSESNGVTKIGFDNAEAYPLPGGGYGIPNAVTRGATFPNGMVVGFSIWQDSSNRAFYMTYDGTGWHPFYYTNQYQAAGLGVTGGTTLPASPVMQIGLKKGDGSAFALMYMPQPTIDPPLANSYDIITQYIFLPVDSGIITDEWKVLEGVRVYAENAAVGIIRVAYACDDDILLQNFTDLGTPIGDRSSVQTFQPAGDLPAYRKIMIRISMTPDGPAPAASTPIIRTIVQRYKQREIQRRAWDMQLFLEGGQMLSNRQLDPRAAQKQLKDLNNARRNKKLVNYTDLVGDKYQVYVESVGEGLKTYKGSYVGLAFTCKVRLVEPANLTNA